MEEKTLVTIGLPVYNGANYIREAIDSVLNQTYKNFELIISDNGSTDDTEKICREYAAKDSRIRYVRHNENRGGYFNYGYCVEEAEGLYFNWIAHDDVLEKDFLAETATYLSLHPKCVLVSGDFHLTNENGIENGKVILDKTREELPWKKRCREVFKYPSSSRIYFLMYGLMKSEMIKKVHPTIYKISDIRGSEMPMLCRIAAVGEIVSIPKILRKFRIYDESCSKSEWLAVNRKTFFAKRFSLFKNVMQIRFDQLRVLIQSPYPLTQKFYVLSWLFRQYFTNFITRLRRAPKKIFNFIFYRPSPKTP